MLFALSMASAPVLAWGSGDCPYSKKGTNQEASNEEIEPSESAKKN